MNLIRVGVFFTCCFLVAGNDLYHAKCGSGKWANTACVELSSCQLYPQPAYGTYKNDRLKSLLMNNIISATCGFVKDRPKVCCPHQEIRKPKSHSVRANDDCGLWYLNKMGRVDGQKTDQDEFPWLALLEYESPNGKIFGCGGVLISDRHVLTAAHCLGLSLNNLTSVRLGEHDLRTAQDCFGNRYSPYCSNRIIQAGIERTIVHEDYSFFRGVSDFDSRTHDIAIIKLDRSVTNNVIKPICLPDFHDDKFDRIGLKSNVQRTYMSVGWGISDDFPKSYVKRRSMMRGSYCNSKFQDIPKEDVFCALSKSAKTACIVDSGGPLMSMNKLKKLTVNGIYVPTGNVDCRINGEPSTFIDVRKYVNWIRTKMDD